jgi:hypothetical protein
MKALWSAWDGGRMYYTFCGVHK